VDGAYRSHGGLRTTINSVCYINTRLPSGGYAPALRAAPGAPSRIRERLGQLAAASTAVANGPLAASSSRWPPGEGAR
jgi:hypothetical protein